MRSRFLPLVLVLALATPSFADFNFGELSGMIDRARSFVDTGVPTPRLMNDLAKLPSFELDVNATKAALDAFKMRPEAATALMGIRHVSKQGDRITIRTKGEVIVPVVMEGKVKGYAKLTDPVSFRLRPQGQGVVVEDFKGISVGPWEGLTVGLDHLKRADWQPAKNGSTLAVNASFWIFSASFTIALPAPSKTRGFAGKMPGR